MTMERAQLTETLNSSIDAHSFSGVISIRRQGTVVYEGAAGYADRSNQLPNTLETRFGIASQRLFARFTGHGRRRGGRDGRRDRIAALQISPSKGV